MIKTLGIIGAGHLGQQIAHIALTDYHYQKVVFFDDYAENNESNTILGSIEDVSLAYQQKQFDELIIGIGYKHLPFKKELYKKFCNNIPFGTIIHSSSWIDKKATIKQGSVIYPNCCIDTQVLIDANTIINLSCTIAHDSYIGKHCFLSPKIAVGGFSKIQEMCMIGIQTTIIDNITITTNVKTGGGTLIIDDIKQSGLYVGNPHRLIKK